MSRRGMEGGWMRVKGSWRSWVGRLSGNEFEVLMGECDRLAGVLRQHQARTDQRNAQQLRDLHRWSASSETAR